MTEIGQDSKAPVTNSPHNAATPAENPTPPPDSSTTEPAGSTPEWAVSSAKTPLASPQVMRISAAMSATQRPTRWAEEKVSGTVIMNMADSVPFAPLLTPFAPLWSSASVLPGGRGDSDSHFNIVRRD